MYSLLQPITRRQPMELLVGDYLAMPKGKGGFMEIGVFVDTFTQRAWGFKFKTHGTRWTTIACLNHIEREHGAPGALMVDGGSHFANDEVREWCTKRGVKFVVVSAYSPWVNGLCEGTNGRLLGRLKRLCAPDLGEDGWAKITSFEDLPRNWPEHLDDAIRSLNHRIIPAFKYSPHELFSGRIVNSVPAPLVETTQVPSAEDIEVQLARTQQQRLDAYAHITKNAQAREHAFNNRIEESHRKQIVQFRVNDLVQVYRSDLDYTFRTERKMLAKWGPVRRVVARNRNAYKIATLEGLVLKGWFSARRLREFTPRDGTMLAEEQKELREATDLIQRRAGVPDEEVDDVPEEGDDVDDAGVETGSSDGDEQQGMVLPVEAGEQQPEKRRDEESGQEENEEMDLDDDMGLMDEVEGGEDDSKLDDGMIPVAEGWSAPGRLRTRHSRQS